jgi:hypothetical protein
MTPGAPDSDQHDLERAPSLVSRLAERLRRPSALGTAAGWQVPLAVASLLAAGPLLTMLGAALLATAADRDAARLREQVRPQAEAQARRVAARELLSEVIARPTLGATLESVARVIPADVTLVRAAHDATGGLTLDFAAPDPDRLRQALRRAPELRAVRNIGQRQGDGAMIVSFRVEGR